MADRLSVLDAMHVELAATRRIADRDEPPRKVNAAYVSLLFACGYAALGAPTQARELQRTARATLAPLLPDPIHAWLDLAIDARLDGAPLPDALVARLDELDRVARYKVDRFREASRLVGGDEPIHAMMRFAHSGPRARTRTLSGASAIRVCADPGRGARSLPGPTIRIALRRTVGLRAVSAYE